MNYTNRYFEKPKQLLKILNENGELSKKEIATLMNLSVSSISNLINEFNREEKAIIIKEYDHNNWKYSTNKKSINECKSYMTILRILKEYIISPEDFFNTKEKELAKKLNVERYIIQKVKAIIKTMPAMNSSDSDELGEL